jgi:hypothetical protein
MTVRCDNCGQSEFEQTGIRIIVCADGVTRCKRCIEANTERFPEWSEQQEVRS